jgi:plastocyanin
LLLALLLGSASTSIHALNNCLAADFAATDRRTSNPLVIANDSPGNPFLYRPRCATIAAGTTVIFRAVPDFGMHPLYGGTVSGGVASIDPASPIGSVGSGTEYTVLIDEVGEFPYFCDFHYANGMLGSLRVVPQLFASSFE